MEALHDLSTISTFLFVADLLEYHVIGKAILINNTLDYDITIKSEYNTSKLNNKVYRR